MPPYRESELTCWALSPDTDPRPGWAVGGQHIVCAHLSEEESDISGILKKTKRNKRQSRCFLCRDPRSSLALGWGGKSSL